VRARPTTLGTKGALFAATIALAFLATSYSNLFFLLIAFLSALGALGTVWSHRNLRAVTCEVISVTPAPAGLPHEMTVRLRPGRGTSFQLLLWIDFGDVRLDLVDVPMLASERTIVARTLPMPRGVHRIRTALLLSRYPLGILQWQQRVATDAEAVAYPAPVPLPEGHDRHAAISALIGQPAVTAGSDSLAGLRPFRDGDSMRSVHWKATARRGQPIVREFDADRGDGREVVFDRRATLADFDRALAILSRLLLVASEDKQRLHLRSQGHDVVYGEGHQPIASGLRWLAEVQPLAADAAAPPVSSPAAIRLPVPGGRGGGR
jgi:uncharacterized protein (DUF58 family)